MSDLERRKRLTFAQAEGAAPLPSQLAPKVLSKELRAGLWALVHKSLLEDRVIRAGSYVIGSDWGEILRRAYVAGGGMVDEFNPKFEFVCSGLKKLFSDAKYVWVFDFLQRVLRDPSCPSDLPDDLQEALISHGAAYRIVDEDTICPISTEEEAENVLAAFAALASKGFRGPRAHLKQAAEELSAGKWADSIRESIHSVEGVLRLLAPGKIDDALKRLESTGHLHPALKKGFSSLYGFTSDEQGIRHPLLEAGDANVDEVDALYMFGACAAFTTYLIGRARTAGISLDT